MGHAKSWRYYGIILINDFKVDMTCTILFDCYVQRGDYFSLAAQVAITNEQNTFTITVYVCKDFIVFNRTLEF